MFLLSYTPPFHLFFSFRGNINYSPYHGSAIALQSVCVCVCVLLLLQPLVDRKKVHHNYIHAAGHGQLSTILEVRACQFLFQTTK